MKAGLAAADTGGMPKLPPMVWGLILFMIACPVLGWMLGQLPGPTPRPERVAAEQVEVAPEAPPSASAPTVEVVDIPEPTQVRAQVETHVEPTAVSSWTSYSGALSESGRNGKPILIDFNAEWCGPCQRMKQSLFDDGQKGKVVQAAVIPVSITDRRREEGRNPSETEDLQQRFQVDAFPTLVVFSPRTGRTMRTQGFGDADRMLQWITEAAKEVQ